MKSICEICGIEFQSTAELITHYETLLHNFRVMRKTVDRRLDDFETKLLLDERKRRESKA